MSLFLSATTAASGVVSGTVTNPLSPTPVGQDDHLPSSGLSSTSIFTMNTSGGWTTSGNLTNRSGAWLTGGNSSDYQVRCTPTSGAFSVNDMSSFVTMSSNRQAYVTRASGSGGTVSCTFTVEIRRVSDSVVVSTTTGCQVIASHTL